MKKNKKYIVPKRRLVNPIIKLLTALKAKELVSGEVGYDGADFAKSKCTIILKVKI